MKARLKQWLKTGIIYIVVIILSVVATNGYYQQTTKKYIHTYKTVGGEKVLGAISDTYKTIIEYYSNYRLSRDAKTQLVKRLEQLQEKLEEVDSQLNKTKPIPHKIDFAYIYHDMKLVRLSLSDTTKDDIVPVIVLHANEGLKELEKEITYIEYR